MIYPTIIAALTAFDQLIKQKIEQDTEGSYPRELNQTNGKIYLYRNHNSGFSFGFLKEYPEIIRAIPLVSVSAIGGVLAFLLPRKGYHLHKLALSLVLAGGISNLYDRLCRGYVVDYFSIRWKQLEKVVLNLGDVFIFSGAILYVKAELLSYLKEVCASSSKRVRVPQKLGKPSSTNKD
ncbi:MAG: signal peptidase II [bacterium]|nr:signal peptidase II [bacterium]